MMPFFDFEEESTEEIDFVVRVWPRVLTDEEIDRVRRGEDVDLG